VLKKILIISYFYPPCNLTASQRIGGWAKYLSVFGYYPIIVTRNWDLPINSAEDVLMSSGTEIKHEKNEKFETYYLPYKASKRDEIFSNNKNNKFIQKLSKLFTAKDILLEHYSNKVIPFASLYDFSKQLLEKDSSIQLLIISGNPFVQFKFGYMLNKKFGIKWIADYRDDWNTSELQSSSTIEKKIISKIQSNSEKKWVASAECITSVSKVYADKIGKFVKKKGVVILNGYDGIEDTTFLALEKNKFNITYNGSLYPTQPIEPILNAIKKIIHTKEISIEIHIHFPGLAFDKKQKKRVEDNMAGYEHITHITDRISKEEVIQIQKKSDVLLMISHSNIKGIPSSKMYEYIGLKKEILLYPNDHDIIEETLNHSGLGIICENENEIYQKLLNLIISKQEGKTSAPLIQNSTIEFYSRKKQTAELAKLLDSIS
jgi:hypothetical protein